MDVYIDIRKSYKFTVWLPLLCEQNLAWNPWYHSNLSLDLEIS